LLIVYCSVKIGSKEKSMQYQETMTLDEKLAISIKSGELWEAGDKEGSTRLMKTAPMPPYLAKVYKEKVGAEQLKNSGWNLSEAEAAFGPNWLNR
jgi:hypothetical protein